MPSARTSVGNKEYEYKKAGNELAAKPQHVRHRREAVALGDMTVAVALRHVVDPKARDWPLSTGFL